jgi:ERCC4-type nuclease
VTKRRNLVAMKTAKELLKSFRLFESLFNAGKRKMRTIKRISSSSD